MKRTLLIAAAVLAIGSPAIAHQEKIQGMDHSKMSKSQMPEMMMADPTNPYSASEMDMHKKMMMAKSGDASEMWTRKMIEHHRGALEMSRVALSVADDAETKKMAQMTIKMQTADIAKLQQWLKSHGKKMQ